MEFFAQNIVVTHVQPLDQLGLEGGFSDLNGDRWPKELFQLPVGSEVHLFGAMGNADRYHRIIRHNDGAGRERVRTNGADRYCMVFRSDDGPTVGQCVGR